MHIAFTLTCLTNKLCYFNVVSCIASFTFKMVFLLRSVVPLQMKTAFNSEYSTYNTGSQLTLAYCFKIGVYKTVIKK